MRHDLKEKRKGGTKYDPWKARKGQVLACKVYRALLTSNNQWKGSLAAEDNRLESTQAAEMTLEG